MKTLEVPCAGYRVIRYRDVKDLILHPEIPTTSFYSFLLQFLLRKRIYLVHMWGSVIKDITKIHHYLDLNA